VQVVALTSRYIQRLVDPYLRELFDALPAVMLVGPRATGKTTTARRLGSSIVRLDRPAAADAVRIDPDSALSAYEEPTVIDEWQLVPDVLGAVKRAVDDHPSPGRFVLTGSTGADLTAAGWPATGRVVRVPLWGLTEREKAGRASAPPFLSRLFQDGIDGVSAVDAPDVRGYVELALRGGYPEVARQASDAVRRAWLASYVDQLVTRDVAMAGVVRDPIRLRRYLQAAAASTAGIPQHKVLFDAADVNRLTGVAYDDLLQALFVTEHVPAWTSSRLGRLAGTPKRYLTDPALLGPLLGLDVRSVVRDADVLGRLFDTFVAAQLRPELPVCEEEPRLFHVRDPHGRHEIDLLAEAADGRVVAFEVKASAAPTVSSGRHLAWMRDRLGERFVIGVVFHTGPAAFRIDERIVALPIGAIWSA
jgi:predicted AAA+ superfamily ATPase